MLSRCNQPFSYQTIRFMPSYSEQFNPQESFGLNCVNKTDTISGQK